GGTDGTGQIPQRKIGESLILDGYSTRVPSVPCVPDNQPLVLAKDCVHFHKASCMHPNPNCLTPLFNCPDTCRGFKPYGEVDAA
ncbi:MAG: hypothetical protein NWE95_07305, partial [Candidatus Bathyarchaeota archaeon]|nr:hypothetical protein [Candidatus Bathyarchaeota archaeon]